MAQEYIRLTLGTESPRVAKQTAHRREKLRQAFVNQTLDEENVDDEKEKAYQDE